MRVDAGTSIALLAQAREDFHEQTAIEAVITFLRRYGCPRQITCDRDPRSRRRGVRPGFPLSAAQAQGTCLGITPQICPPHRPDKNAGRWRDFIEPRDRSVYKSINPARCKKCVK